MNILFSFHVFLLSTVEFDSRIVGLTGPVTAVRQMAQEYRVFFRKVEEEGDDYLVESSHNMSVVIPLSIIYNKNSKLIFCLNNQVFDESRHGSRKMFWH